MAVACLPVPAPPLPSFFSFFVSCFFFVSFSSALPSFSVSLSLFFEMSCKLAWQ